VAKKREDKFGEALKHATHALDAIRDLHDRLAQVSMTWNQSKEVHEVLTRLTNRLQDVKWYLIEGRYPTDGEE